jgi:hypothetical protein
MAKPKNPVSTPSPTVSPMAIRDAFPEFMGWGENDNDDNNKKEPAKKKKKNYSKKKPPPNAAS